MWPRGTTSPASLVSWHSPPSRPRTTGGSARSCWPGSGHCACRTAKRWRTAAWSRPTGDILGVRVSDEGVKFALIADEPGVYFTTPHFDGYPAVLVRLAEIAVRDLEELITEAWLTQAPKKLVQEFLADSL